ncbi:MAG: hypothetical protein V2I50_02365 [Desulfuromusa sp.]|nr:hypothetical protein [Desulfuromusa sp.]
MRRCHINNESVFIGVDFGAKIAGTTAICFAQQGKLKVLQTAKGKDADRFLSNQIEIIKPSFVLIDAPLSLPDAYFGKGEDFFFRHCDRQLKAMSPLFLGGLTARAMQLASRFASTVFIETYPKALAEHLQISHYKQQPINWKELEQQLPLPLEQPTSQHGYDAVLAWLSGYRYVTGQAMRAGTEAEGLITY